MKYKKASPCPAILSWLIEMDNPFCPVHKAAAIVKNADVQKGMTVLDAGCGPGRVTIPLARKVGPTGEIVAMDIQVEMLKLTRGKAQSAKLDNVCFLQACLGDNKLEHDKFDRALLVTVLGEIPDQKAALQEIFDALKPNGILSVTEILFDPHFLSRSTVLGLCQEIGFQEKERFGNCVAYTMNFTKPC